MTHDLRLVDPSERLGWLRSRQGERRLHRWAADHPALADWPPAELIAPVSSPSTDAMQAALVSIAQHGDGEAAVLLLAQLRPGLNRICRWAVASGLLPFREAVPEVRAAFFETVCCHPLRRRPKKIAANLVLDTRQRVRRAEHRQPTLDRSSRLTIAEHAGDNRFDPTGELTDDLAAVSAVRRAIAALPGSAASRRLTADVAYRVWFLDEPRTAVAAELGLGDQAVTVRLHRLRAAIDREQLSC